MYQIGNHFTKFQPSIYFSTFELHNQLNAECVLGVPPVEFSSIHSAALINTCYERIQACLNQPVETEQRNGQHRVQVMGSAVYCIEPDGLVRVFLWAFCDNDLPTLTEVSEMTIVVGETPYRDLAFKRFQLGLVQWLCEQHPGQFDLCNSYASWACDSLVAHCWTQDVQDRVRAQIATEIGLDSDILAIAARIQIHAQPQIPLRLDTYNFVIQHKADYLVLLAEAPHLMPLFTLLKRSDYQEREEYAPAHLDHLQVCAWMRDVLLENGIQPATWRLLCQSDTAWIHEFMPYYRFDWHYNASIAVDLLKIVQSFGTSRLVPPWMLHAVLRIGGNPNSPGLYYVGRLDDLLPICERIGHLLALADQETTDLLVTRVDEIFSWASDHARHYAPSTLRKAGVKWLLRKVEENAAREQFKFQNRKGWKTTYQLDCHFDGAPTEIGVVNPVILDTPLAIWEEGRTMRHCAKQHIARCVKSQMLIVSLRTPIKKTPLATIGFDISTERVLTKYISGFANKLVDPALMVVARHCRDALQLQHDQIRALRMQAHVAQKQVTA